MLMPTFTKRHIAGEPLRSDAHVPTRTLRFGARASSHAVPFFEARLLSRICKRLLIIGLTVGFVGLPGMASAATTTDTTKTTAATSKTSTTKSSSGDSQDSQAVTQGYAASKDVQKGMMVRLDSKSANQVDALTTDTAAQLQGVVVAANDAALTLSGSGNTNQVFVATFGHYNVLVSNQNGPIKVGDYITISSLAGVGMKVDATQPIVLGKATANFTGTSNVVGTAKLSTGTGSLNVSLGMVPVDITVSHNPLQQTTDRGVPEFLKKASEAIAGKPVVASRVYLSLVLLFISALIAGAVLFSGIRGGLIAMGRNPLAKKTILAGILRVVLSGVIVFIVGVFGVYLLLRL